MAKTRILIVDDHPILAEGLRALLTSQPDLEVVGQAQDGQAAIERVEQSHPDVVVMDIAMPKMNGLEATRIIRKRFPETRVLILTQHEDREYVLPLLQAGASGIVLKQALVTDLINALHTVVLGQVFLHPAIATAIVEQINEPPAPPVNGPSALTARERQVLEHIVMGKTNPQIAVALSLSVKTVEFHRSNLMSKLGAHSVADLVRSAFQHGWVKGN